MAANELLPFGQGPGANLLSQVDYNADPDRLVGNQPGVARAQLVNKALLQSSLVAAAVGKFIGDNQGNTITDALTPAVLAGYLTTAMAAAAVSAATTGGNQHLPGGFLPGWQKFPGGVILQWGSANLPTSGSNNTNLTVTFPIAFPTQGVIAIGVPINAADMTNVWPVIGVPVISTTTAQFRGAIPNLHTFDAGVTFGWLAFGY